MRHRPHRFLASAPGILLVGLLVLSASGCGEGEPAPGSLVVVERFVDEPPQRPFRPADLVEAEPVFDWLLRGLGIGADWGDLQEPYRVAIEGAPAEVWMEGNRLSIERPVALDAETIDRIDVVLVSRKPGSTFTGNVSLYWAPPGEPIDERQGLQVPAGELVEDRFRLYQFSLRRHPGWHGSIGRLRIECAIAERGKISLRRLTGFREVVGAEKLTSLRTEGLEVSIGAQSRHALLALPGLPIERRSTLPEGAQLRFAVGAQRGVEQRVELALTVIPEGGAASRPWVGALVPAGDTGETGLEIGYWHPVTVDLAEHGGREVTFRLEATSDETLDLRQGFALWAHPEILAPRP